MAGLEDMNNNGNMTVAGYRQLASTINPDLPGNYWQFAIEMYNKYSTNANPTKTRAVVSDYLKDVYSINGMSNGMRENNLWNRTVDYVKYKLFDWGFID